MGCKTEYSMYEVDSYTSPNGGAFIKARRQQSWLGLMCGASQRYLGTEIPYWVSSSKNPDQLTAHLNSNRGQNPGDKDSSLALAISSTKQIVVVIIYIYI